MKDETYTFIQTVRDRKATAHSARHKKNGSRSRKCTLPSDYLTPAEKKRRNSAVRTYTMNFPHTKKELNKWPEDMQREYIKGIIDCYHPSNKDLGRMLGTGETTACTYVHKLGLSNKMKPTFEQQQAFFQFSIIGGDDLSNDERAELVRKTIPDLSPEPDTTVVMLAPPIVQPSAPTPAPLTYDNISLTFTGTADDLIRVIQTGPIHLAGADTYTFTISAVRKEAD